jgi:hypothetical protein
MQLAARDNVAPWDVSPLISLAPGQQLYGRFTITDRSE